MMERIITSNCNHLGETVATRRRVSLMFLNVFQRVNLPLQSVKGHRVVAKQSEQ